VIDLWHLKTILKAALNIRTDYKYWPKSSSENITTSKENESHESYISIPLHLTRHLTMCDFQPMIHRIDRNLRIRQTQPGIERQRLITLNVGCDECGSTYLSSFFSLSFPCHRSSIGQECGENAYVCVEKKANVQNEGKTKWDTTPIIKRAAAPVSA